MSAPEEEMFDKCFEKVKSFKASLPETVDPRDISLKAKIPFKALVYREALLHRVTELADTSMSLFQESEKVISSMILIRAAHETFALLYVLHKKIFKVVESKKIDDFDEYIMKHTFGFKTKGDDDLPTMPNILTSIDKVDEVLDGRFRKTYESMSEFCHPNCSGVQSAYVKIDQEKHLAYLGSKYTKLPVEPYIGTLYATLDMFELCYNKISALMRDFIVVCEQELN